MNFQLLVEFVELSKCLNFSKAAENLYLTQPVLSRHISELENQLGVQLLVRNTRSVQITEMGRVFAEGCSQILGKYDEVLSRIHYATRGLIGVLSIGYIEFTISDFLPDFLLYFLEKYPQIRLEYRADEIATLTKLLERDELDIGFVLGTYIANSSIYEVLPVYLSKLCAVIPLTHPLANQTILHITDLSGTSMISLSKDVDPWSALRQESLFHNHQAEYNLTKEVSNTETALMYVMAGQGIYIMPSPHNNLLDDPRFVVKELADSDCNASVNILYKKDNPNILISSFVKEFGKYYNEKVTSSL